MFSEDEKHLLQSLTYELKRSNDLRERELSERAKKEHTDRSRYQDWLSQEEARQLLAPYVTETAAVTAERMAGNLGGDGNGWKHIGKRYWYNPEFVARLRHQFETGQKEPIKRHRRNAA